MVKKLGLIINPIAGVGGKVGLKGSDGSVTVENALKKGGVFESNFRTLQALNELKSIKNDIELITFPSEMGQDAAEKSGFNPKVIGEIISGKTTKKNTQEAAEIMTQMEVDLILFSGGDGTARDIQDIVGESCPVVGIPSGVKMHSSVFGINPRLSGYLTNMFLSEKFQNLKSAEVIDLDEEEFRSDIISTRLYGYLQVPDNGNYIQGSKSPNLISESDDLNSISTDVIEKMEDNCIYIVGSGSTLRNLMENLKLNSTLLGVDLVLNKKLLALDVSEVEIIEHIKKYENYKIKILVSPIAEQGYIFGRGNQQISSKIIQIVGKKNIIILSTKTKIVSVPNNCFLVDTGEERLDQDLRGYYRVTVGYREYLMCKIV